MLITEALGLAKPYTIYDAGMIEGIWNDGILLIEKGLKYATIGIKAGDI